MRQPAGSAPNGSRPGHIPFLISAVEDDEQVEVNGASWITGWPQVLLDIQTMHIPIMEFISITSDCSPGCRGRRSIPRDDRQREAAAVDSVPQMHRRTQ